MKVVQRRGYWATSVRIVLVAAVTAVLFSAEGVAHAACTQCTFQGTGAGTSATGANDSGFGFDALTSDTGGDNTATGAGALESNTTGNFNTASGDGALESNTTGVNNTASGFAALESNIDGGDNTATGTGALSSNTASLNTATGSAVLHDNTTGSNNTASGALALRFNISGADNTASGGAALELNTTGGGNTATGAHALELNTTGSFNTASGERALLSNTTGNDNTAKGVDALFSNTTGSNNIGIGLGAGGSLTTGDNNIDIYDPGVAAEANTIRIGTQGTQTATFIAGIFGTPKIKKACGVVVEPTGQVGCVKSSARYKRDIRDMGDASDKLMRLRPVTFRYKADSTGIQQYGLVAEEVEKLYPELVIDGADGKPETVEYQVLPAMLLNEVQKLARENARLVEQVGALKRKDAQIDALAERINALERQARAARPERLVAAMR